MQICNRTQTFETYVLMLSECVNFKKRENFLQHKDAFATRLLFLKGPFQIFSAFIWGPKSLVTLEHFFFNLSASLSPV